MHFENSCFLNMAGTSGRWPGTFVPTLGPLACCFIHDEFLRASAGSWFGSNRHRARMLPPHGLLAPPPPLPAGLPLLPTCPFPPGRVYLTKGGDDRWVNGPAFPVSSDPRVSVQLLLSAVAIFICLGSEEEKRYMNLWWCSNFHMLM